MSTFDDLAGAGSGGAHSLMGFAGERREQQVGCYLLGSYRAYNPVLMRFNSPDAFSPFGEGGLNPYAYCAGDPVNRLDPQGTAWWNWAIAIAGTAIGVVATIASAGAAAPLLGGILAGTTALTASAAATVGAAVLGLVSMTTGIASLALEAAQVDGKAASILGYVSLGTGLVSAGLSAGAKVAKDAMEATSELPRHMGKTLNGKQAIYITDNLYGEGHLAYSTHGAKTGRLMSTSGKFASVEQVAGEIDQELKLLVPQPASDAPLTLLACYGDASAPALAEHLNRPIIAYQGVVGVPGPRSMELPRGTWITPRSGPAYSNHVTRAASDLNASSIAPGIGGGSRPVEQVAAPRWFYPSGWQPYWRPWT